MSLFELNPGVDISDAKTVQLGGQDYLVPVLMLRQTSKIGPVLPKLLEIVNRRAAAFQEEAARVKAQVEAGGEAQTPNSAEQIEFLRKVTLTEDETALMMRAIAVGLSRAYPSATADALYDLPIDTGQIINAVSIILQQTRATRPATPGEE